MTRGAVGEAARPRRWRLVRARGEAVPPSVRLFTARARRRRWRAARPWLVALGVLSLVGGVLAVLYATPLLGVAEVRVVGARLVSVVERVPVAAVPAGGGFAIVDGTGHVFDTVPQQPADLPVLAVPAPGPDDATTRAALAVLGSLTPQLRGQLVSVVADALTRIRLELRGGRSVIWGDATGNDAKARTVTDLLARKGRVIDVSALPVVTMH